MPGQLIQSFKFPRHFTALQVMQALTCMLCSEKRSVKTAVSFQFMFFWRILSRGLNKGTDLEVLDYV